MSDIFYSQVEPQVADELQARAAAGKNRRNDKELQFILGKVANISIEAYEQDFLLSSNRSDQQPMANGVIGGRTVTNSSFLPTGPNGYLNNVSRRIPPVITAGSISISDASLGALNEATVNILVSDINGFEDFERVFLRPGRNIIMRLEHPESAVLTENAVIQVKRPKRQPDTEASSSALSYDTEPQKLNQVKFEGLITTFNTTWNADATITVTLNIRGRTSTFADIHLSQFSNASENEQKESTTFSTSKFKLYESGSKTNPNNRTIITTITQDFEEVRNNSTNGSYISGTTRYLWGELFPVEDNDKSKKEDVISKFISLSTIIQKILVIIGSSGLSGKTALDVGTLQLFDQTNGYEQLKSADPTRVLLYQGTSQVQSSTYAGRTALPWVTPITDGFIRNNIGYLENIFISITELEQIYKSLEKGKTITVKDFLYEISDIVNFLTGGAINLKLVPITIQGEQTQLTEINFDILYFLDSNYEGSPTIKSGDVVTPTKIPMFANNASGTAVRNFNIKMQLPKSAAALAYVLNSDPSEISEESVTPFVSYMYADEQRKQELAKRFKELNTVAVEELANSEKELMQEITSDSIRRMIKALKQYLKFPTNNITTSNQLGRPIFDIEAEFEIDGLNGFRFGDVLDFDGIPSRYRNEAVFIIYNVTHNVKPDGEWTTTIRTRLRTKIS